MKRSEMIIKLNTLFQDPSYRDPFTGAVSTPSSEDILTLMERLGMAPPETFVLVPFQEIYHKDGSGPYKKQYPLVPGDVKLEDGLWYTPQQRVWDTEGVGHYTLSNEDFDKLVEDLELTEEEYLSGVSSNKRGST